MKRRDFLSTLAMIPVAGAAMKLNELNTLTSSFGSTGLMRVLLVRHGRPMSAIEDNNLSRSWMELRITLPKPEAIRSILSREETRD